jgi:hypothetical protein
VSHGSDAEVFATGESFTYGLHREAGAVILKITYGYTVKSHERDPLVDLVEESIEDLSHSAIMPVDIFPFCEHFRAQHLIPRGV